jgi:hypothetical protein
MNGRIHARSDPLHRQSVQHLAGLLCKRGFTRVDVLPAYRNLAVQGTSISGATFSGK